MQERHVARGRGGSGSHVLPNFFKDVCSYKARFKSILKFFYKVCSLTQKAAAVVVEIGRRSQDVIIRILIIRSPTLSLRAKNFIQ